MQGLEEEEPERAKDCLPNHHVVSVERMAPDSCIAPKKLNTYACCWEAKSGKVGRSQWGEEEEDNHRDAGSIVIRTISPILQPT
jgi:hypothetical protein